MVRQSEVIMGRDIWIISDTHFNHEISVFINKNKTEMKNEKNVLRV